MLLKPDTTDRTKAKLWLAEICVYIGAGEQPRALFLIGQFPATRLSRGSADYSLPIVFPSGLSYYDVESVGSQF
jgi:hypothetical protein